SQITGYMVSSNPAGGVDSNAGMALTTHAITGLTNGTAYTFTVIAINANGPSPSSVPSNSVTPSATGTGFAAGTHPITSALNATPTIITTLPVTCPAAGALIISASGESTALSNFAGTAFIGLAYSIARDSVATDNSNVVQSSALAVFN